MAVTVMDEPRMRRVCLKKDEYKRVDVPKSELGELSIIWSLLPKIIADEGNPSPSAIPVGFKKEEDGKWHFLGIVKYEYGLRDLPKSAELLIEPVTGGLRITPNPSGDVTRYELVVSEFPQSLKTKIYEAALKHAGADREMMVKD